MDLQREWDVILNGKRQSLKGKCRRSETVIGPMEIKYRWKCSPSGEKREGDD